MRAALGVAACVAAGLGLGVGTGKWVPAFAGTTGPGQRADLGPSLPRARESKVTQAAPSGWELGPFAKERAPVVSPDPASRFRSPTADSAAADTLVAWEAFATFNPAAVVRGGRVVLLYRAEDAGGRREIGGHTSRLGMAESADGVHFVRRPAPVLYPARDGERAREWPGGVEDPRLTEREDGTYVLTYTQWDHKIPRLAVATSRDLVAWVKHGPAFARAAGGKYLASETKSGAILSRVVGGRVVAARVNGTYWMYYNVPDVLVATSDDLVRWTPVEDANGRPLRVLSPRPGYFDAWLVEAGPPPLLTARGIVMLYNAGNDRRTGDPALPDRAYSAGQALFDARNPVRLLDRTARPFLRPTEAFERSGQYKEGTTFVEALVPFRGRWRLYYGTADQHVGAASAPLGATR